MTPYRTSTARSRELPDLGVTRFGQAMRRARLARETVSLAIVALLLPATFVALAILPRGQPSVVRADGHLERGGAFPIAPWRPARRLPVRAAFHFPCSCTPLTDEAEGERIRKEIGRDCGPWYD